MATTDFTNEERHIHHPHLVIPGQTISATVSDDNEVFLRGHGTYLPDEQNASAPDSSTTTTTAPPLLRASVTGTVQRVNQLITVDSVALHNTSDNVVVGDLVVGRISHLTTARWHVQLDGGGATAILPLSGVALPDQQQRIRTSADIWDMRSYLQPGDMVAAEVHRLQHNGAILLHARSGHGKLEHGGWGIRVPSQLIVRRSTQVVLLWEERFRVYLGCNGWVWVAAAAAQEAVVVDPSDRRDVARVVNAVACLSRTLCPITPEAIETVVQASVDIPVSHMLWPEHCVALTAKLRK